MAKNRPMWQKAMILAAMFIALTWIMAWIVNSGLAMVGFVGTGAIGWVFGSFVPASLAAYFILKYRKKAI